MSVRSLSQQKLTLSVYNKRKISAAVFKSANSGAYNTLAVATHAVGDLMLAMGWGASGSTVPVFTGGDSNTPSWTIIGSPANGIAMYYAIATKTNHSFGTWSSGNNMTSVTISGQSASPIGVYSYLDGYGTNLSTAAAVTGGSRSLILYYGAATGDFTPVSGMTTLHSANPQWYLKLFSKNDPTTAPSSNIFATSSSGVYWAGSALEIK